jgi:hypothetical protein
VKIGLRGKDALCLECGATNFEETFADPGRWMTRCKCTRCGAEHELLRADVGQMDSWELVFPPIEKPKPTFKFLNVPPYHGEQILYLLELRNPFEDTLNLPEGYTLDKEVAEGWKAHGFGYAYREVKLLVKVPPREYFDPSAKQMPDWAHIPTPEEQDMIDDFADRGEEEHF